MEARGQRHAKHRPYARNTPRLEWADQGQEQHGCPATELATCRERGLWTWRDAAAARQPAPGGIVCGTKCVQLARSSGHQGAARKSGSGRVASHIALHGARRGDRGRKGTERQEARDPATRDEGQGKVREGEHTAGRTGLGSRGREGGREGALPRELPRTVLALAGGQRVRDGRAEKGATRCPTTERAARGARGR